MNDPYVPPYTAESAALKMRLAEDRWNTHEAETVARACTENTRWRTGNDFLVGRAQILEFLQRKWALQLEYRLVGELWCFAGDRISGRFAYEWSDEEGRWFRTCGCDHWELDAQGLLQRRFTDSAVLPITASERKFLWSGGARPKGHPGLTELGL